MAINRRTGAKMLVLPSEVVETHIDPQYNIILLDNVKPSCAIDNRGEVFWAHFTAIKNVANSSAMRVIHFPPNGRVGDLITLPFYLNAAATLIEYNNVLYLTGYHNEYTPGKLTHFLSIPIPQAICPCKIF